MVVTSWLLVKKKTKKNHKPISNVLLCMPSFSRAEFMTFILQFPARGGRGCIILQIILYYINAII